MMFIHSDNQRLKQFKDKIEMCHRTGTKVDSGEVLSYISTLERYIDEVVKLEQKVLELDGEIQWYAQKLHDKK